MKTCSVENCNSKTYLKGVCCKHYQQLRLHGKVYRSEKDPNEIELFDNYALLSLYEKDEVIAKAIIDLDDVDRVTKYKWRFCNRYVQSDSVGRLHHFIMDSKNQYDHKDTNTLNNRKSNLRLSNQTQNSQNRNVPSNNTSGAKGVCWSKRHTYYIANIVLNKERIKLGRFSCLIEAANAYNQAAVKLFKEFALLNDIDKLKERIINGEIENKGDGRIIKQYKLN